ncbi:MAG: family 16 glycosylhydrolase, partial [Anaerolineales bacterium]|nr:family 16 glycosylhydrolase [Anaerolineales bacterium]
MSERAGWAQGRTGWGITGRVLLALVLWTLLWAAAARDGRPGAVRVAQAQSSGPWVQTAAGDFTGCSLLTNTAVSDASGGEVRLKSVLEDYFTSPAIDYTRWITGQLYNYGGAFPPVVSSGVLAVNGSYLRSAGQITATQRIIEMRAQLRVPPPNTAWGDIGFGRADSPGCTPSGCPAGDNRLFITTDTNLVQANARNFGEGSATNVNLPSVDPSLWHTYRIEWSPTAAVYYVDGAQAASITKASTYTPYVWLYTLNPGATVQVDWARVLYYPVTTGTFQSCPVDTGATTSWGV